MELNMSLRKKLYGILEMKEEQTLLSTFVNTFILLLILVNVIAVILESVKSLHQSYRIWFWYIELFSVTVFSIEYMVRLWISAESKTTHQSASRARLRYMLTPMAIIDLIAILPFYLTMFFQIDTRILRILRLLRVFKLSRHFAVLGVLGTVLRNESKTLFSAIFVMIIMIVLASAGIYVVERDSQPEVFGSIPSAMWWATVTLTTVGYGDVVPVTVAGRLFGICITVLGVGMAALPAGIIASGFTSELARRRESYELTAKKLLMDGEIDRHDRKKLAQKRDDLGLDRDDARQLLKKAVIDTTVVQPADESVCPHCGKAISGLDQKNTV
jgi:voltage-gated potassium channel